MVNKSGTHRSDVLAINDFEMHVERYGEGAPLLLLHGGGGAGVNWRLVFDLDAPQHGFELIVPDLRGHGRSTNPSNLITFRQLARDVLALMDRLEIVRLKAIGVSMGAKTLLHVATMAPDRVEAMVLVSAAPHFPDATRAIMRAAADVAHSEDEWVLMRRWHVRGDPQIRALWAMGRQFAENRDDMRFSARELGRIRARTLIVHGENDFLYPVSLAEELRAGIPGSELWLVPNGGHGPIFGPMAEPFRQRAIDYLIADGRSRKLAY